MKKINLMILPLLSIAALVGCNNDIKEYEVISKNNIQYLLYNGVDKVAAVVGYNFGLADEITLPSNVNGYPLKAIGRDAFEFSSLSKITIPDSISYIGSGAFSKCSNLKEITLPNALETISSNTFEYCYSITDITLPNSISIIDDEAFLGCYSLTNVKMPTSLFGLGSYAFGGCESLDNVDFSNTRLNDIGSYCFYDCNKLSNISLSNNIKVILERSFSNCSSLKKIFIPKSISAEYTYMGEDIFENCHDDLKILFEGSNLPYIYSPTFSSGYPFALGADKDAKLSDIFVKESNIQYSINDYKTTDRTASVHYEDGNESKITIPATITNEEKITANVTKIMPNAFASKDKLEEVDLSLLTNNLSYIGTNAFYYDTALTKVTLPTASTNTYIDIGAFYQCRNLSSINLGHITDLNLYGYTFAECFSLGIDSNNPFIFPKNIKSITSTDFKEWGAGTNQQYIELESGSYDKDGETVILYATGDQHGEIKETITLEKVAGSDEYHNSKYFGKAIIKLGQ